MDEVLPSAVVLPSVVVEGAPPWVAAGSAQESALDALGTEPPPWGPGRGGAPVVSRAVGGTVRSA